MPVTLAYSTVPALKARLRISDDGDGDILESVLTAASRDVDRRTGRRFYAATETRSLTAISASLLLLPDDLRSITTLRTDDNGDRTYETLWVAGRDYYLSPPNAALDGEPYTAIMADLPNGLYAFPTAYNAVSIAGSWGYCATGSAPAPVEEATLRIAERLYKLRDAPLGVAGTAETGLLRVMPDRDIDLLLWSYRRRRGWA